MNDITNDKISGLAPKWEKFPGFSLLFDHPGDQNYQRSPDQISKLANQVASEQIGFYQLIDQVREKLFPQLPYNDYLFCPLHFSSFHVTVWDGANSKNLDSLHPTYKKYFSDMFITLPISLVDGQETIKNLLSSELTQKKNWGVSLKFKSIESFSNNALVILLEPADDQSALALKRIEELRSQLNVQFQQAVGKSWTYRDEYLPHVSLGYFANKAYGEKFKPQIDHWNAAYQEAFMGAGPEKRTITFNSISLYGFTDMINFFKTHF